ncbi:hypothetical protein GCM10020221_12970 [Streptomyces thioluteus]|uniref:Dynamin N-terminal domain-containing protein n=1 Tax=Streptomyces thioluteus TaxID=66431 RepID=A0ABN3WKK1_STRTU
MGDSSTHPGDAAVVAEALTDAAEHLDFVRRLIEELRPAPERAAAVGAALDQVRRRLADDRLHLAVIGEFSSGKSTFINGLLRMPLLPTDVLPTTAAPVVIEYGPELLFRVRLADNDRRHTVRSDGGGTKALPEDREQLASALRARCPGCDAPGELLPLLAMLTADPRVAPLVSELRVEVPADALADGLVVLDTPGANGHSEHEVIARRVMAESADSAVVLTSALAPVPLSLAAFLEDALDRAMLTRCTFLATYADRIPAAAQPDVLRAIRTRLRARLALPEAAVEAVSADAVVRGAAGEPLSSEQAAWVERFAVTESRLRDALVRQRAVAVGDSTLRLMDRAMRLVREETDARRRELEAEEAALAAARIPDLAGFLEPYRGRGLRRLTWADGRVRAGLVRECEAASARTAEDCAGLVESAASVAVLRSIVEDGVTTRLRDGLREWSEAQQRFAHDRFGQWTAAGRWEVAAAFRKEYARLGEALGRPPEAREPAPPADEPAGDESARLSPVVAAARLALSEDRWGRFGGWAVGTVVGAVVGGPVGAGVGALIGQALGGKRLAHVKSELGPRIRETVRAAFEAMRADLERSARHRRQAAETAFTAYLDAYRTSYQEVITGIAARQHERHAELEHRRAALAEVSAEADRRRSVIESRRALLAGL